MINTLGTCKKIRYQSKFTRTSGAAPPPHWFWFYIWYFIKSQVPYFYLNILNRDFLETLRETAVKEQEVAISQAIANIIKNKQHQESQGYWRAISLPFIGFCAGMLMIGLAAGLVSGLAIAKVASPQANLNPQTAKDLDWLASDDGKMARNLVDWNRGILKTCLQDQQNLKNALIILNGKYVTKGLCALWVLPENQRVYEDPR